MTLPDRFIALFGERASKHAHRAYALARLSDQRAVVHILPDVSGGVATGVEYCARALPEFAHLVVCTRSIRGGAARRLSVLPNLLMIPSMSTEEASMLLPKLPRLCLVWNHQFWDLRPLLRDEVPIDIPLVTQLEAPDSATLGGRSGNFGRLVVSSVYYEEIYQPPVPDPHPVTVIPMAVDTGIYSAICPQPSADHFVIGNVTNGAEWKYADDYIDLCDEIHERVPVARFLLLGALPLKACAAKRPYITVLDPFSVPLTDYLRRIHILLHHTNPSFPETWCLAVTEAMASGIPAVADNRGGLKDQIVQGETGFLCSSGGDFVEACCSMYADRSRYEVLSRQARNRAQTLYSVAALRANLSRILRSGKFF